MTTMTIRDHQGRGTTVAAAADMVDATEKTMVEIDVHTVAGKTTAVVTTKDDRAGTVVMEAVTEGTIDELARKNVLLQVS